MREAARRVKSQATAQTLADVQAHLAALSSDRERQIAEHAFLLGLEIGKSAGDGGDVVVLIHGIRTHAEWQERLRDRLVELGIDAVPIGYGYMDVFRFLCPLFTRAKPLQKIEREFRGILKREPKPRVSVVAHSFGTYLLAKMLEDATDVRVNRVILCGSIISTEYRWDKVESRVGAIVNEVAVSDFWPVLAKASSWGYGSSGTSGFKTQAVHDRYHRGGHSSFFDDGHMEQYWLPFLKDGQIVKSEETSRRKISFWISALHVFPLKTMCAVAVFCVAAWWTGML
ncbi:hypothetical protein [Castellaniella denitrificans]|uniref:Alpha/beta hydrolase n=1 Tax=Castellaniella denitrificans TaxID=56119 RepID=A0ABT4M706_9BURK|nr:hypothetical protein [Castellaniella denitrificans]MCZ4331112.1 hypothetical protein [Castellaniella denitrificans]